SVCEARLVKGFGDGALRAAFIEARERDYAALAEEAAKLLEAPARRRGAARATGALATAAQRLRRRRLELEEIDYFSAPGGFALECLIERLEQRAGGPPARAVAERTARWKRSDVQQRTWVTRKGVHVDRIACAWLIRGWIDPEASFKFVAPRGYRPAAGE